MDGEQASIGERIADARKSAGISQVALAQRARVSVSMVRKVEQGSRDATPAIVAAMSKALSIDVTTLTGQPYDQGGPRRDPVHLHIPALRRALSYWDLPPALETPPRPWAMLRADAEKIAGMRRAAHHRPLAAALAPLLMEVTTAAHAAADTERERYFELLTVLLFAAHSVTYKTGYADLSAVVEDRITWAAARSGDPLMGALAAWARTTSMLQTGSYDIGQRLLDRVRTEIDPGGRSEHRPALQIAGPLHLRSAMLAARDGDGDTARSHLAEARRLATYLDNADHDGDWHQLSFGPSNVTIHEIATLVEIGDGPRAVEKAERVRVSRDIPKIRIGHHFVDLSRAYLWAGDREKAERCVWKARKLAPQQTRHHPTTREVVRMLVRLHRRSNESLRELAGWVDCPR